MGTNCASFLADIFLYSYEAEIIQSLLSNERNSEHLSSTSLFPWPTFHAWVTMVRKKLLSPFYSTYWCYIHQNYANCSSGRILLIPRGDFCPWPTFHAWVTMVRKKWLSLYYSTYSATFTKLILTVHHDMIYWCHVVVFVLDLHFTLQWPRHKRAIAEPLWWFPSQWRLVHYLVVHINLVIACFVYACDDRLLIMRIYQYHQQLFQLINLLFLIIGTSLMLTHRHLSTWDNYFFKVACTSALVFENIMKRYPVFSVQTINYQIDQMHEQKHIIS